MSLPTIVREGHPAADLALVLVAAIWGITFPLVQRAIEGVPTVAFLQARFLFAAVFLAPFAIRRGGILALLPPVSIGPGLFLAAAYILQTEGLRTISPSVSAFLTGTNVVVVPIFAALLGWEQPTGRRSAAVLLALAGIFLLQGMRLPGRWATGETWTLLCAVAVAGQIILLGRVAPRFGDPIALATGQIVTVAVLLTIVGLVRGDGCFSVPLTAPAWYAVLFTGVLATAIAFFVQTWAQERVPSGHVAVCLASEPVFAALYSVSFFGDRLLPIAWLGAGSVLFATILVTTERAAGREGEGALR